MSARKAAAVVVAVLVAATACTVQKNAQACGRSLGHLTHPENVYQCGGAP